MKRKIGTIITIRFGALAEPLAAQLALNGIKFNGAAMSHIQADADAITRLAVRGVLSESDKYAAQKKLFRQINDHINRMNPSP